MEKIVGENLFLQKRNTEDIRMWENNEKNKCLN
jgi:hypothetical protein